MPDRPECVEPGGGEDLGARQAPEVAPVVAVGGADEGSVVVADVLPDDEARPVGQDDVVLGEALLRHIGRRHHHHEAATEAEGEDWPELLGEVLEGSMEGEPEEGKVP